MRINSIRLVNFRQHADTFIQFDDGLTGIIGANGTGKTTILEAIAWALYGNPAARGNRDSIRSLRAGPKASVKVELDFELGGHRYRVVRGLTGAELYLDRATAPIANSITGVSEVLRRRLGMTLDEFFNTYFTGQKELSVMAAMGPTDRAQFLSRLLGYERLRVAQDLARDRRRAITAEATGVKSSMPDPDVVQKSVVTARDQLVVTAAQLAKAESTRTVAAASVTELTPRWAAVQAERARIQRIDADVRVAESEDSARKRELERQDRELTELATAQAEMSSLREAIEPLPALRVKLEAMDRRARDEGRRQALAKREQELAAEIVALHERRTQIETAPAHEQATTRELKTLRAGFEKIEKGYEAARTEWVRDRQEADTRIEQLKKSLAEYRGQRELLVNEGENGTCPICSRPLGDHYRSVLSHIDEHIEAITAEGKYLRARVDQLVAVPPDVAALEEKKRDAADHLSKTEKKLARIQQAVQELLKLDVDLTDRSAKHLAAVAELATVPSGYVAAEHVALRKMVEDLLFLESRATKLAGALEREAQLRLDRARVIAAIDVIRIRLAELAAERATLEGTETRFASIGKAFEAAAVAQRAADVELAAATARQASAVAAAEVAERALNDLERAVARFEELTMERRLHEELDRAYSDLHTELNLQLRPDISERASILLAELTDGRYSELELDEAYNIVVLEDGLPKTVISGGEEDLTNLVLRLAISQMIAERAGQPLSLLILDEIFGSLDESRRRNVVDLLRRLHDRFEQVIAITHVDLDNPEVEHLIRVTYDQETGTSRVVQEAPAEPAAANQLEMGAA